MRIIATFLTLVLLASVPSAAQEKPWFDLVNCGICKHFGGHEDLLQDMNIEFYPLESGVLSVAVIAPEYRETMEEIGKKIAASAGTLTTGEKLPLCGFCESYGGLIRAGARIEDFQTPAGQITVITSSDPKVVEQIQEHARNTAQAREKWLAERKELQRN